jgi:branched-chain amino acid transport system ATP-binding protein
MMRLEDVHAYYGTSHVLQGIDLHIKEGEVVTLLGRNGAGKSTTIKSIMGLVPPKQGRIIFREAVISGFKPFKIARQGIAYVPEDRAIFIHLSVVENLEIAKFGMSHRSKGKWTIDRIFRKFPRLAERRTHRGSNLSGGEQQMLSIARALMSEPDLLLLDEPSEGLAPIIVRELQEITKEIVQDGITVLLIEQNIDMCTALADRHYIIDQGQIVYHGTNQEFMQNEAIKDRYLTLSSVDRTLVSQSS